MWTITDGCFQTRIIVDTLIGLSNLVHKIPNGKDSGIYRSSMGDKVGFP